MRAGARRGLVTTEHCCLDFDGGGPSDDALLVIGVPPDRVMMAAIYERRPGGRATMRRRRHVPASLAISAAHPLEESVR